MKYKISAFVDDDLDEGKTLVALIREVTLIGHDYRAVDFSNCLPHIRDEFGSDYLEIIRNIPAHLIHVDFSSNLLYTLSEEDLSELFDSVPAHIKVINLSANSFHHSMPTLREALPKLPTGIEKIILKLNMLHEIHSQDFIELFSRLNPNIKVIDLGQSIAHARHALVHILPGNYNICSIIENNENETSDPVILDYLQRNRDIIDYPVELKKPFGDLLYATRKLADEKRALISEALHALYHDDFNDDSIHIFKTRCFDALGYDRQLKQIVCKAAAAVLIAAAAALAVTGLIGGAGLFLGSAFITTLAVAGVAALGTSVAAGGLSVYGLFKKPPEMTLIKQAASAVLSQPMPQPSAGAFEMQLLP